MSEELRSLCGALNALSSQFEDNEAAFEELKSRDNAEELLIAMGMADAFLENLITISNEGVEKIRAAKEDLESLLEDFQDEENEEDE